MFNILLALMLILAPANGWCVTQWTKSSLPATGDNLTSWPTQANAQWSILDTLLSNYRKGLALAYSSASTLIVSAGEVVVSNSAGTVRLFLQKTSSTNVTFSNIDTGAEAGSTTYYVYAGTSTATDAAPTFYVSLSSSAPTGVTYYKLLGSFYNNASSDIDQNKIYSEPYGSPFNNVSGIFPNGLKAMYDYGTSASSSTRRDPADYYYVHGQNLTLSSTTTSITNMPFTSTTTYNCLATRNSGSYASQALTITKNSGSAMDILDFTTGSHADWACVGY